MKFFMRGCLLRTRGGLGLHCLPSSQSPGVSLHGRVLVPPQGLAQSHSTGISTNLQVCVLSHASRGFRETLEKEALLDWMETP